MSDRIGIRELKQNASAVVRRAASGETIQITDRGRPVAQITPLEVADGYARLLAEGRVRLGSGHLLDHAPLPPLPGRPLGSEALAALRADER
ncbi:MAG TPA: type II toxin-antitoxin system prevent-host-death family antitoxin [Candidatus Binatia bacterium]|nr:type II toxin-antitoxin system prevent-host-death family antitoxin [Candidatus Binatia bacterium]